MRRRLPAVLLVLLLAGLWHPALHDTARGDDDAPTTTQRIELTEMVAIGGVARGARIAVFRDAVEARRVAGTLEAPEVGDGLDVPGAPSPAVWKSWKAGEKGWLEDRAFAGGYAWARVEVPEAGAWILDVRGARRVLHDGAWRIGDLYNTGSTRIPLALRAGENHLVFRLGRPRLKATLIRSDGQPAFQATDDTMPDFVLGGTEPLEGALVLLNPSPTWLRDTRIRAAAEGGEPREVAVEPIPPFAFRKVGFSVLPPPAFAPWPDERPKKFDPRHDVRFELRRGDAVLSTAERRLRVRAPEDWRKVTFRSGIDDSVQYYGLVPANPAEDDPTPGIILSTHGASVEATNQARAYDPKPWAHIVAPTNRRPFGFDWEDWGRLDALEVLAHAQRTHTYDPARVHITGHSMGGHGAWILGAQFPDQFGALAPSAGWRDFWSYGGAPTWEAPNEIQALLDRCANGSRTLLLEDNYRGRGIYILHGDADRTVPVEQARFMRSWLARFHTDFAYYERPGAGHWWGDQCMDWPPLMQFLEARRIPAAASMTRSIFATVHPWISSRSHAVRIQQQRRPYEVSRVAIEPTKVRTTFEVKTRNVRLLVLEPGDLPTRRRTRAERKANPTLPPREGVLTLDIDGQRLVVPVEGVWSDGASVWLLRDDTTWKTTTPEAHLGEKSPVRCGPFKAAFAGRMVFVVGTAGTEAETRWALAKARYDAEQFWYRGNGSVRIVADREFDAGADPDRSVILYGHRGMNAAWDKVLETCPVDVQRGSLRVGERILVSDDLAAFFVRPRAGSETASVGVIAGTGAPGMRVSENVPIFLSGAGFPDWLVIGADMPSEATGGVRGGGFFAHDWSVGEDAVWALPDPAGRSER